MVAASVQGRNNFDLKGTGNREEGTVQALDEDLNPVQRNRPTHDRAWNPLVGRGNGQATTFVPNQPTQLLPVARSLFPRPKVGQSPTGKSHNLPMKMLCD
ncbi:MAG: hypothetical protein QNJ63_10810 [Calothrix sp. MO_192.B10]|nr:hypothetical protein [Calothrix sp. MO_192.B10]